MPGWLIVLFRSVGLFIIVFALTRALGKKHPAKVTPFRFIVYTVLAAITTLTALNMVSLEFGLIALAVWFLLPLAGEYLATRSKWAHDLLHGRETVVIQQGKVMEENLRQARVNGEELLSELRNKNVFNLADVEFAVMEPSGDLNVLLKSEKTPVTPYDLGKQVSPRPEPQTVILDGNILNDQLALLGLNRHWLKEQLEGAGVSLDNVFIGQVDGTGELYLDLFDDTLQNPKPQVKKMLYASLEKAQASLTTFSLETEDEDAKNMYSEYAGKLGEQLEKLKPHLLH